MATFEKLAMFGMVIALGVIQTALADGITRGVAPRVRYDQGNASTTFSFGAASAASLDDGLAAYARKDYVTALRLLRQRGNRYNAEAEYVVGEMNTFGEGVPTDLAKAFVYYRLSAEQGYMLAQDDLGVMYQHGYVTSKDYVLAVKYFRLAADQGNATAQFNLGNCYYSGEGVPKDAAIAAKYYRLAAYQGFALAQNNLVTAYLDGDGVTKNYVLAYKWYNLAAAGGFKSASKYRDKVARQMTRGQIAEAQKLSRLWKERKTK